MPFLEHVLIAAAPDRELAGGGATGPPLTGASKRCAPFLLYSSAALRTVVGEFVVKSK